ncbi:MAG: hypothetical protein IKQ06_00115 [Bacilli bacterium]|nr:hypothetical protein [Bacilli bacterium]
MDDEITKEIKTISELEEKETTPVEEQVENVEEQVETTKEETVEETTETPVEEVKESTTEEPVITEEKSPKNKKKIILIVGGIILGLIIIIILVVLLTHKGDKEDNKKTKKNNDSPFVTTMKASLKDGSFDKEIKKGLTENEINADSVCILNMDIDSDLEQELVVYAEEGTKKAIFQLEVDEIVALEDSFPVDTKDSLGYVYSSERKENFWYTESQKNYTIISSAKKIIKEDDFLNNYFALTKTYEEKPILDHCKEYKLDGDLDAKKLEKSAITNEKVLEDNKIKEEEIADAYAKYIKEKTEKEAKEKEEAEKKAKEEAERKKLEGTLVIGTNKYKYGTYNLTTSEGESDGVMILYSDLTCVFKGVACTYTLGDVRNAEDELTPGISLSGGQTFITSTDEGTLINPANSTLAKYAG